MAALEMIGRPDRTSGFPTGVDSAATPPSAPTIGFERASASAKAHQGTGAEQPTLTKAELVELLFEQVGLNKREAKDMLEAFFDEISDALERGESVKLMGFGNFQLRDKVSRPGRNPKTGVEANIPACRVVTFQPSQKLKTVADGSSLLPASEHVADNVLGVCAAEKLCHPLDPGKRCG